MFVFYTGLYGKIASGYETALVFHNCIFLCPVLPNDPSLEGDHIDFNGLNNVSSNLRISTHSQNKANTRVNYGTSQFRGVSWSKQKKKWVAQCGGHYIARFHSELEAAKAYDTVARELYGEFARTNF